MTPRQMFPVLHYLRQVKTEPACASEDDAVLLRQYYRDGDERAFTDLVRRHGPRVLAVCRRVLGDRHDAEDAFQATFLLLARKAAGLRQPERLGPWLHGVAVRTALKARGRRRPLLPLVDDLPAAAEDDLLWQELRPMLDDAIASLPGRYRDPVILCYLEGASTSEAALRLGCPPGTISSRLTRARVLLRARLARRGVSVPVRTLGGVLPAAFRDTMVPPLLLKSTCSIGVRLGAVSAAVANLAKGVAMRMLLQKIQGTLLVLVGVVGIGVGTLVYRGTAQEGPVATAAPPGNQDRGTAQEGPVATAAPPSNQELPEMPTQGPPPGAKEETRQKSFALTKNFRVEASSKVIARLIAEAAEQQRKQMGSKCYGAELPDWNSPCPITVRLQDGASEKSHSSFVFNEEKVIQHSMSLEGPLEQILTRDLPREVNYLVIGHLMRRPMPRWVVEGAAVLTQDEEDELNDTKVMHDILETKGRLIPLRKLLSQMDDPTDMAAFRAEGRSLTRFLLSRLRPTDFFNFVGRGAGKDWDNACSGLDQVFMVKDVEGLEKAWLQAVRSKQIAELRKTQENQEGVAPTIVEASFEGKQLFIHRARQSYECVSKNNYTGVTTFRQTTNWTKIGIDPDTVRAFHADGKELPPAHWHKLLATRRPVLLSSDGEMVNPRYLQLLRTDTIILVMPGAKAGGAERPAEPTLDPIQKNQAAR